MASITEQVDGIIFEILAGEPEGLKWAELMRRVLAVNPDLHPKTVNGLIWKLVERWPEKVFRTEDKLFRLK